MLKFLNGIICILLHRPKKLTLTWFFPTQKIVLLVNLTLVFLDISKFAGKTSTKNLSMSTLPLAVVSPLAVVPPLLSSFPFPEVVVTPGPDVIVLPVLV